ncbi:hypothetical protein LZ554_009597 [Drepanopeziza brunnea f. sp. 'monogermtubi']|nr:hypothetical protein LZ554_009597 [Drepanopeziza brunnea f. sp. 'monogermtubi']
MPLLSWPSDFRTSPLLVSTEPIYINLKLSSNELYILSALLSSSVIDDWVTQYGDIEGWYKLHSIYVWALLGWDSSWSEHHAAPGLQLIIHDLMEEKISAMWRCRYAWAPASAKPRAAAFKGGALARDVTTTQELSGKSTAAPNSQPSAAAADIKNILKDACRSHPHVYSQKGSLWKSFCCCYCAALIAGLLTLAGFFCIATTMFSGVLHPVQPVVTVTPIVYVREATFTSAASSLGTSVNVTQIIHMPRTISVPGLTPLQEPSTDTTDSIIAISATALLLPPSVTSVTPKVFLPSTCPVVFQVSSATSRTSTLTTVVTPDVSPWSLLYVALMSSAGFLMFVYFHQRSRVLPHPVLPTPDFEEIIENDNRLRARYDTLGQEMTDL